MSALASVTAINLSLNARLVGNETTKILRLTWRRKAMVLISVGVNALTYLGVNAFIGGGHVVPKLMSLTLPGLLAAALAQVAAVDGSGGVAEEINGGTLEQAQLGPSSATLQVIGRLGGLAIVGLFTVLLLALGFTSTYDLGYLWHPAALVPAVLIVLDALGYGLVIIAMTIRVTSIGAITHVFNMVIMFFGGMLIPITLFPAGIQAVSHVVPTSLGVQAFNATMSTGSLTRSWSDGTLRWLIVHVLLSYALGVGLYVATMRRARREGALSPR